MSKAYVDHNPNPNSHLCASINTSVTRPVGDILKDTCTEFLGSGVNPGPEGGLIVDAHPLFLGDVFDDKYDNIARVAPELKENFTYREFAHIGSSIYAKNIGNTLQRCMYECTYHGVVFLSSSDTVIILSKAHASMTRDK